MDYLNLNDVREYVNENIVDFHERRLKSLEGLNLKKLLKKNPYLFKAKNITTAGELISGLLEAFLSSSEEKLFGDFLEDLAIYIAAKTCDGHKSTAPGVDLEFFNKDVHYIVSIKSGTNWGNSSQHKKLEEDLRNAEIRVKQINYQNLQISYPRSKLRRITEFCPSVQILDKLGTHVASYWVFHSESRSVSSVLTVLGICYGKTRTSYLRGYLKVVGQNFWYLISDNRDLYTDIIEPVGYRAKEHNQAFHIEKSKVINRFAKAFIDEFCDETGAINWVRLVEFNSGNFDLDKFIS